MSDLVEQLKKHPTNTEWLGPNGLMGQAALEIERLRAQLDKQRKDMAKLRATVTENMLLRRHLSTISAIANDPAFQSDAMEWIATQCELADNVLGQVLKDSERKDT